MKKFIKSSILVFTLITSVIMNGCDAFENFVFGLPISFIISTSGNDNSPSGSESYCLDQDETYQDYADKINSIVFVQARVVVNSISTGDEDAQGTGMLRVFEGTGPGGNQLFVHSSNNIKPADFMSPNSYIVDLDQSEIDAINASLANDNTCFYADYVFTVTSGGSAPYAIEFKVDVLYNVDSDL